MIIAISGFGGELTIEDSRMLKLVEQELNTLEDSNRILLNPEIILVINLIIIPPHIGKIPNGIIFRKSSKEYWTTYSGNYDQYIKLGRDDKLVMMKNYILAAIKQLPEGKINQDSLEKIISQLN